MDVKIMLLKSSYRHHQALFSAVGNLFANAKRTTDTHDRYLEEIAAMSEMREVERRSTLY